MRVMSVTRTFPGADRSILDGVSLSVKLGESVAITGPSGSGKSTLLLLMGVLDKPDGGEIWLGETRVDALSERDATQTRRDRIGFVFQDHLLLPHCTALENVLVPTMANRGGTTAGDETRARQVLERFGLGDRLHYVPSKLSTGQRQRVAVARALINQPQVLLADEPTGSLDPVATGVLLDHLFSADPQMALVVVTHAAEVAARADRVLRLEGGVLVQAT